MAQGARRGAASVNLKTLSEQKGFPVGAFTRYKLRDGQGGVVVPYFDRDGNEYIKWRIIRDPSPTNKKGYTWSTGDAPLIPYGLHRPIPYTNGFVWIVEGESDCWTLWEHSIPALGLPGAKAVKPLLLEHMAGVKTVAIVKEPGAAGERFPALVANQLFDQGFSGTIYAVEVPEKDPRGLWLDDPDRFKERLETAYKAKQKIPNPRNVAPVGTTSMSMSEMFDIQVTETEWLIDDLLPASGIMLLSAKPKAGKSVLARNLALSVARGGRFLGRMCRPGVVLWVGLEEPQNEAILALKAMGVQRQDPIRIHFGRAPADAMAWLQAECEAHQVALVVLDTWYKLLLIENINDYAAVTRANEPLMHLRQKGIAQVWIHHNNKGESTNGDEVLGSSAIFSAPDTLLSIRRANDGTRTVRSVQRFGTDMEDTIVAMDPDTFLIHSAGSKYVAQVESTKAQVERSLASSPEPLTKDELVAMIEARKQFTIAAINDLLRVGSVVKASGSGKKGDPVKYALSVTRFPGTSSSQSGSVFGSGSYIGNRGNGIFDQGTPERREPLGTTSEPREPRELESGNEDDGWTVVHGAGPQAADEPDLLEIYAESQGL